MSSEQYCTWVSSIGIAKSCFIYISNKEDFDKVSKEVFLREPMVPPIEGGGKGEPMVPPVYFHVSVIPLLIENIQYIKNPFILVSGSGDTTNPSDIFYSYEQFLNFIENKNIIKWYSQNCIIEHPKLIKIPIGLDYHTLYNNNDHWWGDKSTPIDQEEFLNTIKDCSVPFWQRINKCYSNFHLTYHIPRFGESRKDIQNIISSSICYYEPEQIARINTWLNQSKYAFVISPHGNGLDCHRTWEALVLGCIVIVKKSPLDSLYYGLPVLIVNNWEDITQDLLDKTMEEFKQKKFQYEKLKLDYYISRIRQGLPF